MDHLKEGIGLRSYAQNNPLVEYTNEGFQLFDEMLDTINREILEEGKIDKAIEILGQYLKGLSNSPVV